MMYEIGDYLAPRYEYVSSNQHGQRYKRKPSQQIKVVSLSCKTNDADGLKRLILLGHSLQVPVHYDFEDHTAYIEVMSGEAVRSL